MHANVTSVELPEGRVVRAGMFERASDGDKAVVISIERPVEDDLRMPPFAFRDNSTHHLRFTLSRAAAEALYGALGVQLMEGVDKVSVSTSTVKGMEVKMPWQHPMPSVSTATWFKLDDDGNWVVETVGLTNHTG